jgi:hypothetical protein
MPRLSPSTSKAQPCDGFIEQLVPGACADDGGVVQEAFQLVRQLVRLHRAHPVEHGLVARQIGVFGHQRVVAVVVDPVEFEAEEDQRRGHRGDLVLHVGHELRALGIRGLLVIAQAREGHDAAGDHVDLLVALMQVSRSAADRLGQLALVVGREGGAFGLEPVEIARQFRRIRRGIEVGQVPIRQIAQRCAPCLGYGVAGDLWGGERQAHGDLELKVFRKICVAGAAVSTLDGAGHVGIGLETSTSAPSGSLNSSRRCP